MWMPSRRVDARGQLGRAEAVDPAASPVGGRPGPGPGTGHAPGSRTSRSVARKTAPLLVARLVGAATTLVVLAVVARWLGAVEVGGVAIGLTVGTLLGAVSDVGMTAWMVREIARRSDHAGRYLTVMLFLRAIVLPPMSLVMAILVTLVFPDVASTIIVVALMVATQQIAETGRSVFVARGSMVLAGVHGTVENIVWLFVVVAGLAVGLGSLAAFGLGLVVMGMSSASIIILAVVSGAGLTKLHRHDLRAARRELPVFGVFATASAASQRIDTILVALLLPAGAVAAAGAYFAATRLVAAFEYLPQTLGRAVLPDVARAHVANSDGSHAEVVAPAVAMLLALSIPVPFAMVLGGTWILQVLLGEGSATVGWIMAWLALALPFRFLAYLYGTLLTGSDAQAVRVRALLGALIMLIVVDIIAIPVVGIAGGILGYLGSSLALFMLYEQDARRVFGLGDAARQAVVPLLVSCAAVVPALAAPVALPSLASEPVALGVFGGTYLAITGMVYFRSTAGRGRSPKVEVDAAV